MNKSTRIRRIPSTIKVFLVLFLFYALMYRYQN